MSWCSAPCQGFGHAGRIFGLAYHPFSSDVIASASEDETVRVWRRCHASASWEQTSCCRGHKAEVLRVAWSPDGQFLASGSADHTVRVWQVGINEQQSYSGIELAALNGHPEEVYGLKFMKSPGSNAQQEQQQVATQGTGTNMLLAASGESLYLWDLQAGRMIAQTAPPPTAALAKLSIANSANGSSSGLMASSEPRAVEAISTAAAAAAAAAPPHGSQGDGSLVKDAAEEGDRDDYDDFMPSYIFSLALADGTNWLAGSCSDGMLRMWDGSNSSLTEFAAVQVHGGDMGSCCSFLPGQPWLVQSISKRGQLVLLDLRMLQAGRGPLLVQELEGPVFDATWLVRRPAAAAAEAGGTVSADLNRGQAAAADSGAADSGGAAAAGDSNALQLWLAVVGCDHCVRCYHVSNDAISAGQLRPPELLPVTSGYNGRLLAVAAPLDYSCLAVAGEAVQADTLKPWQPPSQQQQQQQAVREPLHHQTSPAVQQQQQQQSNITDIGTSGGNGVAVADHAAVAAAAAAARRPRAGRRAGSSRKTAVNILDMAEDDDEGDGEQRNRLHQQQQQDETRPHAPNTNVGQSAEETPPGSNLPGASVEAAQQQQQAAAAAAMQQYEGHPVAAQAAVVAEESFEAEEPLMTSCAAMSDVLLRAPLFTWRCY